MRERVNKKLFLIALRGIWIVYYCFKISDIQIKLLHLQRKRERVCYALSFLHVYTKKILTNLNKLI